MFTNLKNPLTNMIMTNLTSFSSEAPPIERKNKEEKVENMRGPRALRRRHGKRMDKKKLKRRSSINGHW